MLVSAVVGYRQSSERCYHSFPAVYDPLPHRRPGKFTLSRKNPRRRPLRRAMLTTRHFAVAFYADGARWAQFDVLPMERQSTHRKSFLRVASKGEARSRARPNGRRRELAGVEEAGRTLADLVRTSVGHQLQYRDDGQLEHTELGRHRRWVCVPPPPFDRGEEATERWADSILVITVYISEGFNNCTDAPQAAIALNVTVDPTDTACGEIDLTIKGGQEPYTVSLLSG